MSSFKPKYLSLYNSSELARRAERLWVRLASCDICPRECRVNRLKGNLGFCYSGYQPIVASFCDHHGEEPVLSGNRGSGTIFLGNCNLRCVYCQNHQISQDWQRQKANKTDCYTLAGHMLYLQDELGCHNINFVSPSHFVPQIVRAVLEAIPKGLKIPLVYNTNGYDSLKTLKELDGIIDIYMPDIKYANEKLARKYSKAKDSPQINQKAVLEMHRQAGDLIVNDEGLAVKGLLIRHLVLPNNIGGTKEIMHFIATKISKNTYINIMDQYFPSYKAYKYPEINRPITKEEFEEAIRAAHDEGLYRLDKAEVL